MMVEYCCVKCLYHFCSENEIPYCPACECEDLKEVEEQSSAFIEEMHEHHLHPRFMDNPLGLGEKMSITQKTHDILHGKIMKWLWNEIPQDKKEYVTEKIITMSKKFIGDTLEEKSNL